MTLHVQWLPNIATHRGGELSYNVSLLQSGVPSSGSDRYLRLERPEEQFSSHAYP